MANLRLAIRTLWKTPFITGIAVLSLALGIGANAAIFSLFDQMLLQPLPVQEPDALLNFVNPGPKHGSTSCGQPGDCDEIFSYPMFRDLEAELGPFTGIAAHRPFGANLAGTEQTLSGSGLMVSGSYFPTLGLRPALGRLLTPEDDQTPGEHFVVVLGHAYWVEHYGADPNVLNTTLNINGNPMTVVGVAAAGFEGTTLGRNPDVYVPITMRTQINSYFDGFERRQEYWAYLFGRLKPGVDLAQATLEINTIYTPIIQEVEAELQEGMSDATMQRFMDKQIELRPGERGQSTLHGEVKTPLTLLFTITGVVLLIACANIANLLLARGANRSHEIAIRSSMGATRGQLLRQLLTESVLLAAVGGVASLIVARWTLAAIAGSVPPEAAQNMALQLSPQVVGFAALLALGTGFLFGLYPAFHNTRTDLAPVLRGVTGQAGGHKAAQRFRSGLVTAQIALSMALLVAAGLFIKSLVNVSRVDLGLTQENVITFGVSPALNGYDTPATIDFFVRAEEALAAIPGVTAVTAGMVPILTGNSWGQDVAVETFENGPDIDSNARLNAVGPGYFRTLGMPLMSGREFEPADVADAPNVAIVNEAFIRKFNLPGPQTVGLRMSDNGGMAEELDMEIVGVVQDAVYSGVKVDVQPLFFTPYMQRDFIGWATFYVRTTLPPAEIMRAAPGVIASLDPNLPVDNMKTLDQQAAENVYLDRFVSALSAAFAVLATLLAAIGLYGVLSYTVAQRTREIGLRMALGAGEGKVRALVLKQVSRMTIIGGLIGVIAALVMGRAAQTLLFGVDGWDLPVVGIVALVLAGVAFGAGYLPARKASRVDPMVALRYE